MNYKEELENIALELKKQTKLILNPKAHQNNCLLQALLYNLNSNKVKVAEYNAKLNVLQQYYTVDNLTTEYQEATKDYLFITLCIDNIVRENESLQKQIDKLLKLYE